MQNRKRLLSAKAARRSAVKERFNVESGFYRSIKSYLLVFDKYAIHAN